MPSMPLKRNFVLAPNMEREKIIYNSPNASALQYRVDTSGMQNSGGVDRSNIEIKPSYLRGQKSQFDSDFEHRRDSSNDVTHDSLKNPKSFLTSPSKSKLVTLVNQKAEEIEYKYNKPVRVVDLSNLLQNLDSRRGSRLEYPYESGKNVSNSRVETSGAKLRDSLSEPPKNEYGRVGVSGDVSGEHKQFIDKIKKMQNVFTTNPQKGYLLNNSSQRQSSETDERNERSTSTSYQNTIMKINSMRSQLAGETVKKNENTVKSVASGGKIGSAADTEKKLSLSTQPPNNQSLNQSEFASKDEGNQKGLLIPRFGSNTLSSHGISSLVSSPRDGFHQFQAPTTSPRAFEQMLSMDLQQKRKENQKRQDAPAETQSRTHLSQEKLGDDDGPKLEVVSGNPSCYHSRENSDANFQGISKESLDQQVPPRNFNNFISFANLQDQSTPATRLDGISSRNTPVGTNTNIGRVTLNYDNDQFGGSESRRINNFVHENEEIIKENPPSQEEFYEGKDLNPEFGTNNSEANHKKLISNVSSIKSYLLSRTDSGNDVGQHIPSQEKKLGLNINHQSTKLLNLDPRSSVDDYQIKTMKKYSQGENGNKLISLNLETDKEQFKSYSSANSPNHSTGISYLIPHSNKPEHHSLNLLSKPKFPHHFQITNSAQPNNSGEYSNDKVAIVSVLELENLSRVGSGDFSQKREQNCQNSQQQGYQPGKADSNVRMQNPSRTATGQSFVGQRAWISGESSSGVAEKKTGDSSDRDVYELQKYSLQSRKNNFENSSRENLNNEKNPQFVGVDLQIYQKTAKDKAMRGQAEIPTSPISFKSIWNQSGNESNKNSSQYLQPNDGSNKYSMSKNSHLQGKNMLTKSETDRAQKIAGTTNKNIFGDDLQSHQMKHQERVYNRVRVDEEGLAPTEKNNYREQHSDAQKDLTTMRTGRPGKEKDLRSVNIQKTSEEFEFIHSNSSPQNGVNNYYTGPLDNQMTLISSARSGREKVLKSEHLSTSNTAPQSLKDMRTHHDQRFENQISISSSVKVGREKDSPFVDSQKINEEFENLNPFPASQNTQNYGKSYLAGSSSEHQIMTNNPARMGKEKELRSTYLQKTNEDHESNISRPQARKKPNEIISDFEHDNSHDDKFIFKTNPTIQSLELDDNQEEPADFEYASPSFPEKNHINQPNKQMPLSPKLSEVVYIKDYAFQSLSNQNKPTQQKRSYLDSQTNNKKNTEESSTLQFGGTEMTSKDFSDNLFPKGGFGLEGKFAREQHPLFKGNSTSAISIVHNYSAISADPLTDRETPKHQTQQGHAGTGQSKFAIFNDNQEPMADSKVELLIENGFDSTQRKASNNLQERLKKLMLNVRGSESNPALNREYNYNSSYDSPLLGGISNNDKRDQGEAYLLGSTSGSYVSPETSNPNLRGHHQSSSEISAKDKSNLLKAIRFCYIIEQVVEKSALKVKYDTLRQLSTVDQGHIPRLYLGFQQHNRASSSKTLPLNTRINSVGSETGRSDNTTSRLATLVSKYKVGSPKNLNLSEMLQDSQGSKLIDNIFYKMNRQFKSGINLYLKLDKIMRNRNTALKIFGFEAIREAPGHSDDHLNPLSTRNISHPIARNAIAVQKLQNLHFLLRCKLIQTYNNAFSQIKLTALTHESFSISSFNSFYRNLGGNKKSSYPDLLKQRSSNESKDETSDFIGNIIDNIYRNRLKSAWNKLSKNSIQKQQTTNILKGKLADDTLEKQALRLAKLKFILESKMQKQQELKSQWLIQWKYYINMVKLRALKLVGAIKLVQRGVARSFLSAFKSNLQEIYIAALQNRLRAYEESSLRLGLVMLQSIATKHMRAAFQATLRNQIHSPRAFPVSATVKANALVNIARMVNAKIQTQLSLSFSKIFVKSKGTLKIKHLFHLINSVFLRSKMTTFADLRKYASSAIERSQYLKLEEVVSALEKPILRHQREIFHKIITISPDRDGVETKLPVLVHVIEKLISRQKEFALRTVEMWHVDWQNKELSTKNLFYKLLIISEDIDSTNLEEAFELIRDYSEQAKAKEQFSAAVREEGAHILEKFMKRIAFKQFKSTIETLKEIEMKLKVIVKVIENIIRKNHRVLLNDSLQEIKALIKARKGNRSSRRREPIEWKVNFIKDQISKNIELVARIDSFLVLKETALLKHAFR